MTRNEASSPFEMPPDFMISEPKQHSIEQQAFGLEDVEIESAFAFSSARQYCSYHFGVNTPCYICSGRSATLVGFAMNYEVF